MLAGTERSKTIVIESDNCSAQYKCTAHFFKLQSVSNERNATMIRCYGVAGHGKGEVDHVGGLTKVKIRREVAAGHVLQTSSEMVEWLQTKFETKRDPIYVFKNFEQKSLEAERATQQLKRYATVNGSANFQVIVFRPNEPMKASLRICICERCLNEYGSCELFREFTLTCNQLNKTCLRSQFDDYTGIEKRDEGEVEEETDVNSLCIDSVVALAASKKSLDPFYLIKITQEECPADEDGKDSWGKKVMKGQLHLRGQFYEKQPGSDTKYRIQKKDAIFFRESVVYPCVQLEHRKQDCILTPEEFIQIVSFIENSGLSPI